MTYVYVVMNLMFIPLLDQVGFTALHHASQQGHYEVVRLLLEAKAIVNIQNMVSKMYSHVMYTLPLFLSPNLSVSK